MEVLITFRSNKHGSSEAPDPPGGLQLGAGAPEVGASSTASAAAPALPPEAAVDAADGGLDDGPPHLPTGNVRSPVRYFTDLYSGVWAAATTLFCTATVLGGNLVLLAAALGERNTGSGVWWWVIALGVGVLAVLVASVAWTATNPRAEAKSSEGRARLKVSAAAGSIVLIIGLFPLAAGVLASSGRVVPWQPVVAATLAANAVVALGGYYLASRRARIAIAASFLLFFLTLFSFMLSLEALNAILSSTGEEEVSASAVRALFDDFRGQIVLILGFYFGSDAAVNVVKLLRTPTDDVEAFKRADRDLATEKPDAM